MNTDDLKALITRVKGNLRVTKVVATRSFKSKQGDFLARFGAGWNTVQDDAGGPGADMDLAMTTGDFVSSGMTLKEAVVAHNVVAMQADIACFRAARANNAIDDNELDRAVKAVQNNYGTIIRAALIRD